MSNKFAVWLISLSLTGWATAQVVEPPILGLPFGQKLDRPIGVCPTYMSDLTDYCSAYKPIDPATVTGPVRLMRPYSKATFQLPEWMDRKMGVETVFDTNRVLVSIQVFTIGPAGQDRVIGALTDRFGKPTTFEVKQAKNAYGATWGTPVAQWVLPNLVANFSCAGLQSCLLRFATPEQEAREKADFIERRKLTDKL